MPRHLATRTASAARAEIGSVARAKACRSRTLAGVSLLALLAGFRPAPSAADPPIQFTRTDYSTGNYPLGVAIADLNGDGRPDLVIANQSSNSVSVLLANGSGGFASKVDFAAGIQPFAVAVGDLDGNGTMDLAVANIGSSTVTVLLGDGAGGFGSRTDLAVALSPISIAITDLNSDGKLDIVTANHSAHSISVLAGIGGGAFAAAVNFPIGEYPYAVAIGDLNRDGHPDVAAVNYYQNTLSVRLGDGNLGFGPVTTFPTGVNPSSVAIADVNVDGNPDVVVANSGSGSIWVLPGDGFGSFGAKTEYLTTSPPVTVAVGDLNTDGRPDLVATNRDARSVSVFLANSAGGFNPKIDFATGAFTWAVAIRDLNGDGLPDLAVTNASDANVSVLTQFVDVRQVSSTSLASDVNPSSVGQTVTLTATVSPSQATGTVDFVDGVQSLGTATLNAGTATFATSGLRAGIHSLTATYGGDGSYRPSVSPSVSQTVRGLASSTVVSSSVNPSVITQSVSFTAVVTAVTTGGPTPTGIVQFLLDGANLGTATPLASGQATSPATSSLSSGNHTVQAIYAGDGAYEGSTSPTLTQVVEPPSPVIVGVRDVPHDQGGHVVLTWRCRLDQPGFRVVTGYRVWRRAALPSAAARALARATPAASQETFWEAIATLPAEQLVSYAFTAPTTQDSMADSNPYTALFVTALTSDPFVFYQSAPDSGYSVDNLSPPTPAPFAAVYGPGSTALHWGTNPAPDLREFRLYRGLSTDFLPGPGNLVIATRDTGYVDPIHTAYVYKLDAVDVHGNTSRYAVVTPNGPVATLASVAGVEPGPDRIRITWYAAGNAGMPATLYRRTAASDWVALATLVADGTGYLRYEDRTVSQGGRYGYRLGISDGGSEIFAGEVWVSAEALVFALEGARPNPSSDGQLTVWFSLPDAAPGRLEVLDIGGRRVRSREVGSLGPGRHTVNFAEEGRLPPGIYFVRLTHGPQARVLRAAVMN